MQAPPSWHARKRVRALTRAAVGAVAAGGLALCSALPATAALGRVDPGVEITGVTSYGTVWLGAVEGTVEAQASGWLSWCITAGYDSPDGAATTAVDYVDDPELAWIVQAHEGDATALSRAAIAYLSHTRHETGTDSVSAATRVAAFEAATPDAVKTQAAAYLAEAASQAGPYSAGSMSVTSSGTRTGTYSIDPLVSRDGTVIEGRPMTLALNGPAVWDSNGNGQADPDETSTWSGTSQASRITLAWVGTGNGEVTISRVVSGLPRTTLTKLSASGQVQDSLTYGLRGPSDPEEIADDGPSVAVVLDFQPVATSDVADAKVVEAGGTLSDRLTVSVADGDEWASIDGDPVDVTFEGTAYSTGLTPAGESASVPEGAEAVATATVVADGPGTYSATADAPSTGQVVTWVWRVVKAHQAADVQPYIRGDWSDSYGLAAETASVRHDTVEVDSTISTRTTKSATYVLDDLFVSGFPEDHTQFSGGAGLGADVATMDQELWFFAEGVEVSDENLDAAQLISSTTVPAVNGYVTNVGGTDFKTVVDEDGGETPGTYVWRTVWAGDDRVAPFTSSVADVTEQYVVVEVVEEEPLVVTTQAHSDVVLVAGSSADLWDVATVSGTAPVGASIEWDLFQWDGDEAVCTQDSLVEHLDAVELDGEGQYASVVTTVEVIAEGQYGYVETVRNDQGQILHRGECGAASETLTATAAPETPVAADDGGAAADAGSALAVTGVQAGALAGLALVLVTAGGALVAVRRRRAGAAVGVGDLTV